MADSAIEWTDYTFNPWRGCTKISAGCAHCYAETLSKRNPAVLGEWGPHGKRVVAAESYWQLPLKWDREAQKAGERRKVFCLSLGDVFEDRPELVGPRYRLWGVISDTPNLDWLLLTKRPENIAKLWPSIVIHDSKAGPRQERWTNYPEMGIADPRIWLGVSVEDMASAVARVPLLHDIAAVVRFVSYEPALGPVSLWPYLGRVCPGVAKEPGVDWVIAGAESGPGARPMSEDWVRKVRDQCVRSGAKFFYKQKLDDRGRKVSLPLLDGRRWAEFPEVPRG